MVGPVIDACVHHHWNSQLEVTDRMSEGWREHLGVPGSLPGGAGAMPILPAAPYRHPSGDYLASAERDDHPAGTDPALTVSQVFGDGPVRRAILSHDRGMFIPSVPNTYRASAVAAAMNDWTTERWLEADDRFFGLVVVPNQTSDDGAAEIRRAGARERMVGVLMAANGLGKPFGHPAYHPIYAAAAELDLPVVLHAGGDVGADTLTHPTAGGLPATFGEISALAYSPMMTHVQSLIVQGVFEKYPSLRVFVSGVGAAWIPGLFFRLDVNWRGLRREVPWVRRPPSEYFREHVRVATWPFDRPAESDGAERVVRALDAFGGTEDLLCFASGYPHWNTDTVADIADRLPDSWHRKVFHDNARDWFRWPDRERVRPSAPGSEGVEDVEAVGGVEVGAMPVTGERDIPPAQRFYPTEDGREIEWVPAAD
ncbi:MAG: amidohydrolase family protein [Pseudonocardiaceae bacterium]|nr:amidohydrolase family protein [Pseudonocardiaceae bacterium]